MNTEAKHGPSWGFVTALAGVTLSVCWLLLVTGCSASNGGSAPAPTIADLEAETKRDPQNAEAWARLAIAYHENMFETDALTAANTAIEVCPNNPAGYVARGLIGLSRSYGSESLRTKIRADFTKAIELNPRDPEVYLHRGRTGTDAEQMEDIDRALAIDSQHSGALIDRAFVIARDNNASPNHVARSIRDMNQVIERGEKLYAAHFQKGKLLLRQHKRLEAVQEFQVCRDLEPEMGQYSMELIAEYDKANAK